MMRRKSSFKIINFDVSKKFMIIIMICLLGFLVSCSDNTTDSSNENTNDVKITVYVRQFEDWSVEYTRSLVDNFNELDNGIQVTVKFYYMSQYYDQLASARESGKTPDIYVVAYSNLPGNIENNYVIPLTDYFTQEELDDIKPTAYEQVEYDGEIYAYPWLLEPSTFLYYRKDILADYGYNEPPTTLEELYEIAAAIQPHLSVGQYVLGLPLNTPLGWATWGMQYNLTGGLAVSDDWMTLRLENSGYKDLAELFYLAGHNGWAPLADMTSRGFEDITVGLCEGTFVMNWGGSWDIAAIMQDYPEMADKIGIAMFPTLDGDQTKTTATNGGWSYVISSTSSERKQAAAAEFIRYMFVEDTELAAQYFIDGYMSKVPTTYSVTEYLQSVDTGVNTDWIATVQTVSDLAISEPRYSWDITNLVKNMLETCMISDSNDFDSVYSGALTAAITDAQIIMSRSSYSANPYD